MKAHTLTNNATLSNGMLADGNDPYDNSQANMHENMSHPFSNNHHHYPHPPTSTVSPQMHPTIPAPTLANVAKVPKQRKKRKANDMNTSFEDEAPTKARKRRSKLNRSLIIEVRMHSADLLQRKALKKQRNSSNILCNNCVICRC
jgi:hypothetical protein